MFPYSRGWLSIRNSSFLMTVIATIIVVGLILLFYFTGFPLTDFIIILVVALIIILIIGIIWRPAFRSKQTQQELETQ